MTRDIRAFASNAEIATTLLRSLQHGSVRIVLTPTPTVSEDGILRIDLNISPQISDVDGLEEYRRLWDLIIARAAPQFTADLASAIEASLRATRRPE